MQIIRGISADHAETAHRGVREAADRLPVSSIMTSGVVCVVQRTIGSLAVMRTAPQRCGGRREGRDRVSVRDDLLASSRARVFVHRRVVDGRSSWISRRAGATAPSPTSTPFVVKSGGKSILRGALMSYRTVHRLLWWTPAGFSGYVVDRLGDWWQGAQNSSHAALRSTSSSIRRNSFNTESGAGFGSAGRAFDALLASGGVLRAFDDLESGRHPRCRARAQPAITRPRSAPRYRPELAYPPPGARRMRRRSRTRDSGCRTELPAYRNTADEDSARAAELSRSPQQECSLCARRRCRGAHRTIVADALTARGAKVGTHQQDAIGPHGTPIRRSRGRV